MHTNTLKQIYMDVNEAFVKYKEIYDFAGIGKELETVVSPELLMTTPVAPTLDSGLAYPGAILYHTIMVYHYARQVANMLKSVYRVNDQQLAKVVALHQLGKVGMYTPNAEDWQVKKLGKVYTFVEQGVCLKTGDMTKLMCSNAGISFTKEEYEALSIMDKSPEEYESMNKFRSHLSTILRMANDLAYLLARERAKQSKNGQ